MATETNELPPRNHNNPPDPLVIEADERIDTAEKWLTERPEITDAEMADKASFFITQVAATHKALDDQRLEEGRAFKAAQEAKYSKPLSMLVSAKDKLTKLRRAWLLKEEARLEAERKAREEAARKAAEEVERARIAAEKSKSPLRAEAALEEAQQRAEEAAAAVEQVPEKAQIRGQYTTKAVGLREVWGAEIVDFTQAFKTYKKRPEVVNAIKDAMEKVAKADAQKAKDINAAPAGVKYTVEKR